MGTTPKLLIPYVEPTDLVANFPSADSAKATKLEALLCASAWTALTAAYPGTLRYAVMGGFVIVDISMQPTMNSGTIYTLSSSPLPANLRPVGMTARGYADFSGYPGGTSVGTDGRVQCRHNSGSDRTNVAGQVWYPYG